jgi:hypothetical protein
MGFWGRGEDDEVQSDVRVSIVWSPTSFASCCKRRRWLEMSARRRASVLRRITRFPVRLGKLWTLADASGRGREGGRKEGSGHHGWVGIGDARRRRLQVPDEKFVRLERFFVREKKRGWGRSDMAIYSRGWRARGARVWTRGRSDGVDGVGLLQVSWTEVEGDPDGRAPLVNGRRS